MAGEDALLDSADRLEDTPIDLNATVAPYLGVITIALGLAVLILLVLVLVVARRQARLDGRLRALTRGAAGDSLEAVLGARLDKVDGMETELRALATRTGALEVGGRRAFQRVGLVRYNPFEDTGGNQSFALALLDAEGDGWILSSLHARSGTRVYAKAITGGRSDAALSDEETAAIRQATA